jgi:hypothetical protein
MMNDTSILFIRLILTASALGLTYRLVQSKNTVASYIAAISAMFLISLLWLIDFGNITKLSMLGINMERQIGAAEDTIKRLANMERDAKGTEERIKGLESRIGDISSKVDRRVDDAERTLSRLAEVEQEAKNAANRVADVEHRAKSDINLLIEQMKWLSRARELEFWAYTLPDGAKASDKMASGYTGSSALLEDRYFKSYNRNWYWPCGKDALSAFDQIASTYPLLPYAPIARVDCLKGEGNDEWHKNISTIQNLLDEWDKIATKVYTFDLFKRYYQSLFEHDTLIQNYPVGPGVLLQEVYEGAFKAKWSRSDLKTISYLEVAALSNHRDKGSFQYIDQKGSFHVLIIMENDDYINGNRCGTWKVSANISNSIKIERRINACQSGDYRLWTRTSTETLFSP